MRRMLMVALAASLAMAALAAPATAITRGGVEDGDDHPYVGLMVATDGDGVPLWRCSGSLIDATTFVTAGHCTAGADGVELWFASDLEGLESSPGTVEGQVSGTAHTHPDYDDATFWLHDLGVVVLDEPMTLDDYAALPDPGLLETLERGRKRATVTAVGYGLQAVKPEVQAELTRYRADLMVVDGTGATGLPRYTRSDDYEGAGWFHVSGDAKHGGTCSGDSGGPVLVGDVLLGVVSYGLNAVCGGVGGAYRIDHQSSLDFIANFIANPETYPVD